MSEPPPNTGPQDDVDDRYRRAAALDSSRPSDSVRRSVLDHAAKLAAERSLGRSAAQEAPDIPKKLGIAPSAANQPWWRPAVFGTLAAAGLAGLLIAPQYLAPRSPSTVAKSRIDAPRIGTDAAPSPPLMAQRQSREKDRAAAENAGVVAEAAQDKASSYAAPLQSESPADTRNAPVAPTGATPMAAPAEAPGATGRSESLTGKPAGRMTGARNRESAAALRQAAETGDVQGLKTQLEKSSDIEARDSGGRTALMLATLHGQVAAVEALLGAGADANAADGDGVTPLQAAMNANQPAIAAALRRAGAH